MIKAICFDYGGVIGGVGAVGANFTQQACEVLGVDMRTYKDVYFGMNHKINTGEIETWREFWRLFVDTIGKPDTYDAIVKLSEDTTKQLDIVDDSMLNLVDELHGQGYKTGLLSNATIENGKSMRKLGVDGHFDSFHISAETKHMKPSPVAFIQLAESLQVQPSEMIFIDDSEKSLSTAEEVGFVPIRFESRDKLRDELVAHGVLFA